VNEHSYCTFHLDGLVIGVAVDCVEEVLRNQTIIPVPLAHTAVAGLLNLRGQVVTAIDARRRLGLEDRHLEAAATIVVLRSGDEVVSLVVDRAGDVVEIDMDRSEEVPATVSARIRALITCAYEFEGGLLLVLDTDRMLAVAS
jgi:purine-binding chemotaxis protein CheW